MFATRQTEERCELGARLPSAPVYLEGLKHDNDDFRLGGYQQGKGARMMRGQFANLFSSLCRRRARGARPPGVTSLDHGETVWNGRGRPRV